VLVHDGVYSGTGNYNISFEGMAITVKSFNPRGAVVDVGDMGDGFLFTQNETSSSVLEGFVIKNAGGGKGSLFLSITLRLVLSIAISDRDGKAGVIRHQMHIGVTIYRSLPDRVELVRHIL